jgi:hypothetical protein
MGFIESLAGLENGGQNCIADSLDNMGLQCGPGKFRKLRCGWHFVAEFFQPIKNKCQQYTVSWCESWSLYLGHFNDAGSHDANHFKAVKHQRLWTSGQYFLDPPVAEFCHRIRGLRL